VDILGLMNEENVLVGSRFGCKEIGWVGYSAFDQPVVNAAILLGGKNVGPDREIIVVAVYELEREHTTPSTRHSATKNPYHTRFPRLAQYSSLAPGNGA
jgi:hypothetical protein